MKHSVLLRVWPTAVNYNIYFTNRIVFKLQLPMDLTKFHTEKFYMYIGAAYMSRRNKIES